MTNFTDQMHGALQAWLKSRLDAIIDLDLETHNSLLADITLAVRDAMGGIDKLRRTDARISKAHPER